MSTEHCTLSQVEYQKYFCIDGLSENQKKDRKNAAEELLIQFQRFSSAEASMEQIRDYYVVTLLFPNFERGYADLGKLNLISIPGDKLDLPITIANLKNNGWKTYAGQIYPFRTGSFDYYYFLDSHNINKTIEDISYSESIVEIREDSPDTLLRVEVGFYKDAFTDAHISHYLNVGDMTIDEAEALAESMRSTMVEYDENGIHYWVSLFDKYVCAHAYISKFGSPETIESLKMKGAFSTGFTGNTVEEIRAELEKNFIMQ